MKNWQFTTDRRWQSLHCHFDWVSDMVGVLQNPVHHAEGDVAEHTKRVVEAVIQLNEYPNLSQLEQEILWTSALLHDVEKRSTTKLDFDGEIISPGHAKLGEFTARQILFKDVVTPFEIRENICAMVRFHGLPIWLMDKPNPQKELLLASLRLDTNLLVLLAQADVYGRECLEKDQLLQRIELFQLYCQEQQCWRESKVFLSNSNRYCYFHQNGSLSYQPYDDYRSQVILMSGLPGMGKDSYIDQYYSGIPVISLDTIRRQHKIKADDRNATGWVVQQAKEQAKRYLRQGQDFIWNATNITRQMRTQLVELFVSYQAKVSIVYIEVPYKKWCEQNRERGFAVPDTVMQRMLTKLEPPTLDEAHEVIHQISDN